MTAGRSDRVEAGEPSVLIVDDHPVVREGLKAMLNVEGIVVAGEARTGAEAVEKAMELNPNVVLMDVNMPDMDGLEATRRLKEKAPLSRVIIVTGVDSRDYLRQAIAAGAVGYLVKGMTREVLVQAVLLVEQGGSLIDATTLAQMANEGEWGEGATEGLEALSPREREVMGYLVRGLTNKEIAQEMSYSVGTVKNAVQRIIEKLGVADRTQAAVYAVRAGFPPDAD